MGRAASAATAGSAALLAVAGLLAGCTGTPAGPTPSPSPSTVTSSAPAQPQTLHFSVYGDAAEMRAYRAIAESFEADHPGVTVVLQKHSDAAAAGEDAFADLSTPRPPAPGASQSRSARPASPSPAPRRTGKRSATPPDVFLLDQHFLPDLVSTGRLHPLDDDLEDRGVAFGDDFQRIALTSFSADAALQCMPFEMSPTVLFVNQRLVRYGRLDAEGIVPPDENASWSFQDFDATARLVASEVTRPGFKAVYLPDDADLLSALMDSAGGDIVDQFDDPTTLQLDSGAGREALTAYADLARDREAVLTDRQALRRSPLERFADGDLAFLFGTRADVPELRAAGVPFDVLSVPKVGRSRSTSSVINGLCVDADSPVRETAVDFVAHAVSDPSQARAARSGALVPAGLDVVNSRAFTQPGRRPLTVTPFLEGQKRSVFLPYSRGWRLAATRISELMSSLAAGSGRDLEERLDRELPAIDEESTSWFDQGDADG